MIELDRAAIEDLLSELDARLRERGVAASIYLVGGAAIALGGIRDGRRTVDVDGVFDESVILADAQDIARERHLPEEWLNARARMWTPPLPTDAQAPPTRAGLTIHIAPDDHLLAMKMVASRSTDARDIVALVMRLGMQDATPEDFASLMERVYGGPDYLATVLGPERHEALRIGQRIVRMLRNRRPS